MALNLNNTKLVFEGATTGAGGDSTHRVWSLATADAPAAVETGNACNIFKGHWQKGDTVIASMTRGGTPVAKTYIVTASTPDIVIAVATPDAG